MASVPRYPGPTLADILADMIRSALIWEENHGLPLDPNGLNEGLTGISLRIHWPKPEEKPASIFEEGEGEDDYRHPKPKQEP